MTQIESQEVEINNSAEKIFNFITNFNNFSKLMPSSVKDVKTTAESCCFSIKGMPSIKLKLREKIPFSLVSMISEGGHIEFHLNCVLQEKGNNCKAKLFFEAELNMMMKMMVEKPLKNFLNILVDRLKEIK